MDLIQRQDALLRYQQDTLLADFELWRNITTTDSAWQKHYTWPTPGRNCAAWRWASRCNWAVASKATRGVEGERQRE